MYTIRLLCGLALAAANIPTLCAKLLQEVTEDIALARGVEAAGSKGGPENNLLRNNSADSAPITNAAATARADAQTVSQKVARGGEVCFEHTVTQRGERSELAMMRTEIGGEYWYGWSMLLPDDFDHFGHKTIVMQLATWPSPRNGRFPASANGSYLQITSEGVLEFVFQYAGKPGVDTEVKRYVIHPDITKAKGRWFDFVMHAKWTGDPDGFLKFWVKHHDNHYEQKIAHTGRTFWNDEDRGPYFKMGAYTGDPNWGGPERITLYTDEYRQGDANSSFDEVAPAGADERRNRAGLGNARYVVYPSLLNRQEIPIIVYTPPGYDDPANANRRYPVVYNLHGAGGGSPFRQWERTHRTLARAMDEAAVEPMIYVFVNGLGSHFFIDFRGEGLQIHSCIVRELIPYVDANYRTISTREGRAADGFSMGGCGALMLAMKNPDLFSAVVSYGGAVITGDRLRGGDATRWADRAHFDEFSPWGLVESNTAAIRDSLRIRLVCGDADGLYDVNVRLRDRLIELGIPVDWVSVPGVAHDTKGLFDRTGIESLRFIEKGFHSTH